MNDLEEHKRKTRELNQDFIDELKQFIKNGDVAGFFIKYNHVNWPTFLEILDCFEEAGSIKAAIYDYMIENVKFFQMSYILSGFIKTPEMHSTIMKDLNRIFKKINIKVFVKNNGEIIEIEKSRRKECYFNTLVALIKIPQMMEYVDNNINLVLSKFRSSCYYLILETFLKNDNFKDFCEKHGELILSKSVRYGVTGCLNILLKLKSEKIENYIEENFLFLLKNAGKDETFNIIKLIESNKNLKKLLKTHKQIIIETSSNLNVSKFAKENLFNIVKPNRFIDYIFNLLPDNVKDHGVIGAIIKNKLNDELLSIVKDVSKKSDVSLSDIKFLGNGYSNLVFQVGDNVLKIGHQRWKFNCPVHYRILNSFMREKIVINKNPVLFIEGQKYLKNKITDISDIREWLEDITDAGLIYNEPNQDALDNFRRLDNYEDNKIFLKPNRTNGYYKIENQPFSENFIQNPVVCIDSDFFWKKDDKNIKYMPTRY